MTANCLYMGVGWENDDDHEMHFKLQNNRYAEENIFPLVEATNVCWEVSPAYQTSSVLHIFCQSFWNSSFPQFQASAGFHSFVWCLLKLCYPSQCMSSKRCDQNLQRLRRACWGFSLAFEGLCILYLSIRIRLLMLSTTVTFWGIWG